MRSTLMTAAAYFAFAMTGTAFAAETQPSVKSGAVLENIYDAMQKNSEDALGAVLASAETRLEPQVAALEERSEPTPAITVASN